MWAEAEAAAAVAATAGAAAAILAAPPAMTRQVQPQPLPLNTVALLKAASEVLGLGPGDAMYYAEKLYLNGLLSYPADGDVEVCAGV